MEGTPGGYPLRCATTVWWCLVALGDRSNVQHAKKNSWNVGDKWSRQNSRCSRSRNFVFVEMGRTQVDARL